MMTQHYKIMQALWRYQNPYEDFHRRAPDLQGWGSEHSYLTDSVLARKPNIIVEVGVWKGASVVTLAKAVQKAKLDAVVIAIDTWLGSWDHWINDALHSELNFDKGYPNIYSVFLSNMVAYEVTGVVAPLPLDSVNAYNTLIQKNIEPDIIHIDGGHDFDTVMNDLTIWWRLLRKNGIMIVDDYYVDGALWPDVLKAVNAFVAKTWCAQFEHFDGKCRFIKP